MKIIKIAMILSTTLLAGCSSNYTKSENRTTDKASPSEIMNGPSRFLYLLDDNLTLVDFKNLFKDDFDEKSKHFNPQTSCYEYRTHIYPSLNKPLLIGFDKSDKYVYFTDISSPKAEKRSKIVWVKEYRKEIEKKIEEKQNRKI